MLIKQLAKRKQIGNFRSLKIKENLIDFASNDYLGLSKSKLLRENILSKWKNLDSLGSTGSRLLTGNNSYIENLENEIALFHGFESGLIFNCGYMANLGLASCIATKEDVFLFDAHIHASLHEGILMSKAESFPFRHNDLNFLENRLKQTSQKKKNIYICIESIYSTDGSIAPLDEIFQLSQKYNAHLIVDEAHAVGVFGEKGKGLVFDAGLSGKVFAQIITFGKALGVFGAAVLGNQALKETLINFAKPFIYTTALPFFSLAAIKCSYGLLPKLEKERAHLKELINLTSYSKTPIQPIFIQSNEKALALVSKLEQEKFDVRALLSPTVQKGKERLRLTLHAFNSKKDLHELLQMVRNHG